MPLTFHGIHAEFLSDTTPEICLEGSRNCGKTIVCLWKELDALREHRGMWSLICRYSDDATQKLLKPELERVARIHETDLGSWNQKEQAFELPSGSRVFMFGLQTTSLDPDVRYKKIRGLSVSRIYIDQAEELPGDIASELRFPLRPNITARHSGKIFPTQLTFSPNPPDKRHWLNAQFPEDNRIPGRRYYRLSIYDNKHNLDPKQIEALELEFPVRHPKHNTLILGLRGPTIINDHTIYGDAFIRDTHVAKDPVPVNPHVPLLEVLDFGKLNPCVLWSQFDQWGRWIWLGGMMGQGTSLGAFCDALQNQRSLWFPQAKDVYQACNPAGMHQKLADTTLTAIEVLRQHQLFPRWIPNSNQPIIRRAAIDRTIDYMRKRTTKGEAFVVDGSRWLIIAGDDTRDEPFGPEALQFGYVWSPHTRRTANKSITVPVEDGWYEHIMTCAELTELNFGRSQQTEAQIKRRAAKAEMAALRKSQIDHDEKFRWNNVSRYGRRAGY